MTRAALAALAAALCLSLAWGLGRDRAADRAAGRILTLQASLEAESARLAAAERRAALARYNAAVARVAMEDAETERASADARLQDWKDRHGDVLKSRAPDALLDLLGGLRPANPGSGDRPDPDAAAD